MAAYKFTSVVLKLKAGGQVRVRFYESGIYTILDANGEHEVGMWKKQRMFLANGELSKDRHSVEYSARSFLHQSCEAFTLRELAHKVLFNYQHRR